MPSNLKTHKINIDNIVGFALSDGNKNVLYFPLRRTVLCISHNAFDIITSTENRDVRRRLCNQISAILDEQKETDIFINSKPLQRQNLLGLALTTQCNLNCTYCHANAGTTAKFIDPSIIDASIDHVFSWCKFHGEKMYLVFTGSGEPTYNWAGMKRAVERARGLCGSANLNVHISMATNGVFGDDKRRYILDNFDRVTISLDGPPDIHDLNRPRRGGQGSYLVADHTAQYFYDRGLPVRIRVTITKKSVPRMGEIFGWFNTRFPEAGISLEPLSVIGRAKLNGHEAPDESDFAEEFLNIIREYGADKVSYSAVLSPRKLRSQFCSPVSGPALNVDVHGRVHSCSRSGIAPEFYFGHFSSETGRLTISEVDCTRLSAKSVDDYPECADCFARYNCAGDCHDLRSAGISRCTQNKKILWGMLLMELE